MNKILLLFAVFIAIGCKDRKSVSHDLLPVDFGITINDHIIAEDHFKVIVNAVVLKDDKFQLYYKDHDSNQFTSDKMIEVVIKGKNKAQNITYNLPPETIPTHFRLDFGVNFSQMPIKFHSILIRYGNREYTFDKEQFAQLFKGNQYTRFNVKTSEIQNKVKNNSYDPHFVSINIEEIIFQLMK